MFDKLKYASLEEYRKIDSTGALPRFAEEAAAAILGEIARAGAKNVAVGGHAVYTPAIAIALARHDVDSILKFNMGFAEGIRLTFKNDVFVKAELIK
jgi:hypothetical protein